MNGVLSMQVALNVVRCDGVVYVISQQIVQVIMRWEDDMVSLQYPTGVVSSTVATLSNHEPLSYCWLGDLELTS